MQNLAGNINRVAGNPDLQRNLLETSRNFAASSRNLTLLRALRGPRADLRPVKPLSVEYVGIQFDHYLGVAR